MVLHIGGSVWLQARAKVCDCQIAPKPPPTEEREKKRWVGVWRERAWGTVKVFPLANTECWRLYRTEVCVHTYTHITHIGSKLLHWKHTHTQVELWFRTPFDWVGVMFPWEASGICSCTNIHTRTQTHTRVHTRAHTHLMQASKLFLHLVNVSSLPIHHPYACMFSNEYQRTCACTHTRTHPHRVPLLSFYTSCSPPCVFTQPPELSERKRERYQGLIYKTAHRVQTTACARRAKNTHSQTHTVHACEQNGSVFTVRLGDEEQAFLKWRWGGWNQSIHSFHPFIQVSGSFTCDAA